MLNGLRILIADQHVSVRTWMREQLSVIGATSIAAVANASELMRQSRAHEFDVVICDHHLDEKRDGQELLEELRFHHILPLRSVFVIATAERKYNHVVAAAEFAPDDYLVKPFTPGELALRLDRALRKKKALRPVFECLEVCDHDKAIDACDQVVRKAPRYALDALRIKAESLVAVGRIEEATTLYESIAETRAVPWARMGFAMMLQRQRKTVEARNEAYQLNQEYPEFLSVYDLLAKIHEEAGELDEAMSCLEHASSITSSSNTDRLRKIVDIAETSGDRAKMISTLKRIVDRTRRSSMRKVDDYLTLTRSLLEDQRIDEATLIADEMRADAKQIESGELASEVASAMVSRSKGKTAEAKSSLDNALGMFDREVDKAADMIATELADEAVQQGEVGIAASIVAKLSVKQDLSGAVKNRLSSWFGVSGENETQSAVPASDADGTERKNAQARPNRLAEQLMQSMAVSMESLDAEWSPENAAETREKLIDAFTLMPRDKRVIAAHIRYNSIAVRNGGQRHSPTVRART